MSARIPCKSKLTYALAHICATDLKFAWTRISSCQLSEIEI